MWSPNSITVQVAFVLVIGLLVSQFLSAALRSGTRDDSLSVLENIRIADRVATAARLMDGMTPDQRQAAARSLSRTILDVRWGERSALPPDRHGRAAPLRHLTDTIHYNLSDLRTREIRASYSPAGGSTRIDRRFRELGTTRSKSDLAGFA